MSDIQTPAAGARPRRSSEEKERQKKEAALREQRMGRDDRMKALDKIHAEIRTKMKKVMTEDELFLLDNGMSNQEFHYHGSAKFFGQAGKAFAEAFVDLKKE